MVSIREQSPVAYFKDLHRGLCAGLSRAQKSGGNWREIDAMLGRCFREFDRACENAGLACHGGCSSCCTIRVVATAPEILLVARTIAAAPPAQSREFRERVSQCALATKRLGEKARMSLGVYCPFVADDLCAVYAVRPLACRGHASYDKQACFDALHGRSIDIPVSAAHLTARSLIQNAAQAALRDKGYAWGVYELNQALDIALADAGSESAWLKGADIFRSALIEDVSEAEMAQTCDAIKTMPL